MRRIDAAGPNTRYIEEFARRVSEALIGGARADYDLGRLIDEVIVGHYWSRVDWPGSPEGGWPDSTGGFKEWCWHVLGFRHRKAYYLRNLYLGLTAMEVDERSLLFVRTLRQGWTKVALILREARTKDRLSWWLDRCESPWCPACGYISTEAAEECPDCGEPLARPLTESALKAEIAMALGGPDDEGDAGGGDGTPPPMPTTEIAKKTTRVEFPLTFENEDAMRLFIRALDVIKGRTDTESNGEAAARMAAAYFAACPTDEEGGLVMEVEVLLQIIESAYGVRLRVLPDDVPDGPKADAALEGFG